MKSFSVRIFLGYFLILSLAAGLMVHTHVYTVQPAMRQTVEDALADTAYLLSAALSTLAKNGEFTPALTQQWLDNYQRHPQQALIWGVHKQAAGYHIYITDNTGKVIADTQRQHIGADYSRWNDIYLTLRGLYGARASRESEGDGDATTLYVAAPIHAENTTIIGAVSVGRDVQALQPYVDGIRADIFRDAALMLGAALLLAALFSAWISRSVSRVAHYAHAVSQGERNIRPPTHGPREIRILSEAVEAMRKHLEGKAYVEQYVHALTHALKSPLAGIQAHLELLEGPVDDTDKPRLLGFAQQEARRMQDSIERLLQLARLEQQQSLQQRQTVDLLTLADAILQSAQPLLTAKSITAELQPDHVHDHRVEGEAALIHLALDSLLANAMAFSPKFGHIRLSFSSTPQHMEIRLCNTGAPIPDYALPRIFERFFSLPRPDTGQRSSGLGLSLAREIAMLHGGDLRVENTTDGVEAILTLAAA